MKEEWKKSPSFPGYEASSLGEVRSVIQLKDRIKKTVLIGRDNGRGYLLVHMMVNGKRTGRCIHRVVADAFIGPCPDGREVNHIDCDKLNNLPSNLEYVTRGRNIAHAYANGRRIPPAGERNCKAKLTEAQVAEIRRIGSSIPRLKICEMFNIKQSAVSAILTGKHWKAVTA